MRPDRCWTFVEKGKVSLCNHVTSLVFCEGWVLFLSWLTLSEPQLRNISLLPGEIFFRGALVDYSGPLCHRVADHDHVIC